MCKGFDVLYPESFSQALPTPHLGSFITSLYIKLDTEIPPGFLLDHPSNLSLSLDHGSTPGLL